MIFNTRYPTDQTTTSPPKIEQQLKPLRATRILFGYVISTLYLLIIVRFILRIEMQIFCLHRMIKTNRLFKLFIIIKCSLKILLSIF